LLSASPTNGNAAGEQDVAAEDGALARQHHDQVLGRVGRTQVVQVEANAAEIEALVLLEPMVGIDQRHAGLDPGEEVARALLEPPGSPRRS
jgi:hypothetical protein